MGTLTTTNFGWEYPDSDGSDRIWEHYDTVFPEIDADVKAVKDTADAAVPLTDFSDALTDYSTSFTITAATTNPTKGNSTYVAKYLAIGKMMWYSVKITIGSTFSAGSGVYSFLSPQTLDTNIGQTGAAKVLDAGTKAYIAMVEPIDSTHFAITQDAATTALTNAGPGTAWATGDIISFSGWWRLA